MDNLTAALADKKIEDLKFDIEYSTSNLIEPTVDEINLILAELANGTSYKEIKGSVRRFIKDGDNQVSAQGFSYSQIKEIDEARKAKVIELEAKEV